MSTNNNWEFFRYEEFACRHCGRNEMDPDFITRLDEMRRRYGRPIVVNSGYRCPDHNEAVSSTGRNGPHTTGRAADVRVLGRDAYLVISLAPIFGFTGLGVAQKGDHGSRFIHLDTIENSATSPRPWVWSY